MTHPRLCMIPTCQNKPAYREHLCTPCQLAGATMENTEAPARRDQQTVVVLTVTEARALLDELLVSDAGDGLLEHRDSGGGDLGRAFRVLRRQLSYLESARTDGGHRKKLDVA